MRLLNSTTLEFKVFNDEELPPYAILSHTWGQEEISYQDQKYLQKYLALSDNLRENEVYMVALEAAAGLDFKSMGRESMRARAGYSKLEMTARIAKAKDLEWFWVDTCCIDKSSSAELQEAINSMYRWYQNATYCIVFLEDVVTSHATHPTEAEFKEMLHRSRWITRGWTLQELIAPSVVAVYDCNWKYVTEKHKYLNSIRIATGIPEYVLDTGDLSRASVAQKMAWASKRTTSRIEDLAYSLLGIFQVYMPMLYGEREHAFLRLQEDIIRTNPDDSIFAWTAAEGSLSTYRGLLARSPSEFKDSHLIFRGNGTFASSNLGLRVDMVLTPYWDETRDDELYLGVLNGLWGDSSPLAIMLRKLDTNRFARVYANHLGDVGSPVDDYETSDRASPTTIYVEHIPQIPAYFRSRMMYAFHFRRRNSEKAVPTYAIFGIRPTELSDKDTSLVIIPRASSQRRHDFLVSDSDDLFVACVKLIHVPKSRDRAPECPPRELIVGYDLVKGSAWCRILGEYDKHDWPSLNVPAESWRAALENSDVLQDGNDNALISTGIPGVPKIYVRIIPGLYRDQICLMVDIDGLSKL